MTSFNVDFSQAMDFEPLPVGWYPVEVTEAALGQSQSGNAKISLVLEITDGEFQGRRLFTDMLLEANTAGARLALGRTRQAFQVLLGDAIEAGSTDEFIGCVAQVRVTQQVWKEENGGDGSIRNRISGWRASEDVSNIDEMFAGVDVPDTAE